MSLFSAQSQKVGFILILDRYDANDGLQSDYKVYATLKGAGGPINAVAISDDGKLLASGGKFARKVLPMRAYHI